MTPGWIGKYRVARLLGQGGMGSVYLAYDEVLNRPVAIKLLRDGAPPEHRSRFELELSRSAQLRHPNIVAVWDSGVHKGQLFMVMEYLDGETLAALIERREPLPIAISLRHVEDVCLALSHVHQAGFVHRDVKPSNIMVGRDGWLKLVDFGIARATDSDLTGAGAVVGTMSYMAPEQITGGTVDARADIFATGLVLYELLSYRRAFGDTHDGLVHRLVHEQPVPLATLCPDLPADAVAIVDRALEKNPKHRYQDIRDMRRAIAVARARIESAPRAVPRSRATLTTQAAAAARTPSKESSVVRGRRLPAFGGACVLTAALSQLWIASAFDAALPNLPASPMATGQTLVMPVPPAVPLAIPAPMLAARRTDPATSDRTSAQTLHSHAEAAPAVPADAPVVSQIADASARFLPWTHEEKDNREEAAPLVSTSSVPHSTIAASRASPSRDSAAHDIRQLLERQYADAMSDRRVDAVSAIYPAVDAELLQKQFATVRSWRVGMQCAVVSIASEADAADATCTVRYQTELTSRPGRRESSEQSAHVHLTRRADAWTIDRVRFGR
jgi:serine/threonine-protein kinase